MYYLRKYTSRDDLISKAIERYLYFYNNKRYQQRLKCMTPMEFLIKCFVFHCLLDRGHIKSARAHKSGYLFEFWVSYRRCR